MVVHRATTVVRAGHDGPHVTVPVQGESTDVARVIVKAYGPYIIGRDRCHAIQDRAARTRTWACDRAPLAAIPVQGQSKGPTGCRPAIKADRPNITGGNDANGPQAANHNGPGAGHCIPARCAAGCRRGPKQRFDTLTLLGRGGV